MNFELTPFHKDVVNGTISNLEMLLNDRDPITGDKLEPVHRKRLLIGASMQLQAIWDNLAKFDFDMGELTATECYLMEKQFTQMLGLMIGVVGNIK